MRQLAIRLWSANRLASLSYMTGRPQCRFEENSESPQRAWSTARDAPVGRMLLDQADSFAVREAALKELQRLGADAEPAFSLALRQAPSSALRTRLLVLLNAPGIIRHS